MLEAITLGQLLAYRLGRLKDSGKLKHTQVSMAKRHNVMAAREVAASARWTLGANGVHSEYQVMRHMCNIESVFTYEGTHDIHTLVLGQDITGIPAFN
jgi:glutaryl-CoA dehydrogenase